MSRNVNVRVSVLRDCYKVMIPGRAPVLVRPSSGRPTNKGAVAAAKWVVSQGRRRRNSSAMVPTRRRNGHTGPTRMEIQDFFDRMWQGSRLMSQAISATEKAFNISNIKVVRGQVVDYRQHNPRRRNSQDDEIRALERAAKAGDPTARAKLRQLRSLGQRHQRMPRWAATQSQVRKRHGLTRKCPTCGRKAGEPVTVNLEQMNDAVTPDGSFVSYHEKGPNDEGQVLVTACSRCLDFRTGHLVPGPGGYTTADHSIDGSSWEDMDGSARSGHHRADGFYTILMGEKDDVAKRVQEEGYRVRYSNRGRGRRSMVRRNPRPSTTRSKSDRDVIAAFLQHQAAQGRKLTSTGTRLDGNWMGGRGIAEWKGQKLYFPDKGSKAAETVERAVRKMAYDQQFGRRTNPDLSGNVWGDERRLRGMFSWFTKVGAAPKFGSTSIHNYQMDQAQAYEILEAAAAHAGFRSLPGTHDGPLGNVRLKNGIFEMSGGRGRPAWVPLISLYSLQSIQSRTRHLVGDPLRTAIKAEVALARGYVPSVDRAPLRRANPDVKISQKLASAGSLEALRGLIAQFYYSTPDRITLIPQRNYWQVQSGSKVVSPVVAMQGKKFVFGVAAKSNPNTFTPKGPSLDLGGYDQHAATELELYIENEGSLDPARRAVEGQLVKKIRQNKYDYRKAPQAYAWWLEQGAKKYAKKFADPRQWHVIFPKIVRDVVAVRFARDFEARYRGGEIKANPGKYKDPYWSGRSYAPKCQGPCGKCGGKTLHHEADSHYCTACDDFVSRPQVCRFRGHVDPDGRITRSNPQSRSGLERAVYARFNVSNKGKFGGKFTVMLTGNIADRMGYPTYTNLALPDISDAELAKLADVVGARRSNPEHRLIARRGQLYRPGYQFHPQAGEMDWTTAPVSLTGPVGRDVGNTVERQARQVRVVRRMRNPQSRPVFCGPMCRSGFSTDRRSGLIYGPFLLGGKHVSAEQFSAATGTCAYCRSSVGSTKKNPRAEVTVGGRVAYVEADPGTRLAVVRSKGERRLDVVGYTQGRPWARGRHAGAIMVEGVKKNPGPGKRDVQAWDILQVKNGPPGAEWQDYCALRPGEERMGKAKVDAEPSRFRIVSDRNKSDVIYGRKTNPARRRNVSNDDWAQRSFDELVSRIGRNKSGVQSVRRRPLRGDYDSSGRYWGAGLPLFDVEMRDGDVFQARAISREGLVQGLRRVGAMTRSNPVYDMPYGGQASTHKIKISTTKGVIPVEVVIHDADQGGLTASFVYRVYAMGKSTRVTLYPQTGSKRNQAIDSRNMVERAARYGLGQMGEKPLAGNPRSFDDGQGWANTFRKAGGSGLCKRCKGAGRVKLGKNLVNCPMCRRKAKNPLNAQETGQLVREAKASMRASEASGKARGGKRQEAWLAGAAMGRAQAALAYGADVPWLGDARTVSDQALDVAQRPAGRKRNPLDSHNPATCRCWHHKKLRGEGR